MVQVSNPADLPQSTPATRRHRDPPKLWMGVAIASIGLHGWLLAMALPLMTQVSKSQAQTQTAPVPIEMVELLPTDAAASTSTTSAPNARSATATDAPTSENSQPNVAPPEPAASPLALNPQPDQLRVPDAAPERQPSSEPPDTRSEPLPQLSPDVPNEPPQNPVPPSEQLPAPNSNDGNLRPESGEPVASNELPTPVVPDGSALSETAGAPEPNPDPSLPDVAVTAQAQIRSFRASLQVADLAPDGGQRDSHTLPPVPIKDTMSYDPTSDEYANCSFLAGSVSDFGQTVYLTVIVEQDGHISDTLIHSSTDPRVSEAYQNLAQCLIRDWRFTPAQDAMPETGELVPVADDSLVVAIKIDQQE
jgi:hypothetical protein